MQFKRLFAWYEIHMKNGGLQPEGYIPLSNNQESTFMAMLVGAGEFAKHDKETGIYIFPITMLDSRRKTVLFSMGNM